MAELRQRIVRRCRLLTWIPCLVLVAWGCDSPVGLVELNWQFVDASASDQVQPTCELAATDTAGNTTVAIRMRLTVSRYDDTCDDPPNQPECIVAQETFACDRERGTLDNVPATDDPYMMMVDALVDPAGGEGAFVPPSDCVATPAPRLRTVEGGRISDLAVYQVVIHAFDQDGGSGGRYDLETCGASP